MDEMDGSPRENEPTVEELQEKLEAVRGMQKNLAEVIPKLNAMVPERTSSFDCPQCGNTFPLNTGWIEDTIQKVTGEPYEAGSLICRECYIKARNVPMVERRPGEDAGIPAILATLESIGVNLRLHGHLTIAQLSEGPANDAARRLIGEMAAAGRTGRVSGLYIWGGTGTGKSQLAVCVIRELVYLKILNEKNVVYDRARAMITQLQDRYATGRVDEFSDRRRRARLWVYEDAGTEKLTPDAFRIFEDILDARDGHPTIITSNLNRSQLIDRWVDAASVERFRSRISIFHPIQLTGKDRRFA